MDWIDLAGYLAALLVLATFCMKTMIPLRLVAVASNVAFIVYGAAAGLTPVLALHLVLLPLNVWRTLELRRLMRRVEAAAASDFSLDWLQPFMKSVSCSDDTVLFRRGDPADRLFCVVQGNLLIEEAGLVLGPGEIVGEMGLFSPERRRTMTVRAVGPTELLWASEREIAQICTLRPEVAFLLLRLITGRLLGQVGPAGDRARGMTSAPPSPAEGLP